MSESYADIKNASSAPTSETPNIPDEKAPTEANDEDTASPSLLPSVDQRRLMVLIGLVVVLAVAIWWVRENGGASSATADGYEIESSEFVENGQDDEIHVPTDGDELDKDEAVYDALVEQGAMKGGGD